MLIKKQHKQQKKINIQELISKKQLKTMAPPLKNKNAAFAGLQFIEAKNNHRRQSLKKLIYFKCIISQELPKMPRDYIAKLLFDGKHESLLASNGKDGPIIGGVCFRCFEDQDFVEIVFLAVENAFKNCGIGTNIIDRLKQNMQKREKKLLLTYADNTALGFFRKQGFQAVLETPICSWSGFIKIYLQGTLMECKIYDGLNYTRFKAILGSNKADLIAKIKQIPDFKYNTLILEKVKQKYLKQQYFQYEIIPGVLGARWSTIQQIQLQKQSQYSVILQQLSAIQSLRKLPASYIFQGLVQLPFISPTNKPVLETWSSIERKIISGRNYLDTLAVCKGVINMIKQYQKIIDPYSKQASLIEQFEKKTSPILTSLQQRKLAIHIDPIFKEKQAKPRKSNHKSKSSKKN